MHSGTAYIMYIHIYYFILPSPSFTLFTVIYDLSGWQYLLHFLWKFDSYTLFKMHDKESRAIYIELLVVVIITIPWEDYREILFLRQVIYCFHILSCKNHMWTYSGTKRKLMKRELYIEDYSFLVFFKSYLRYTTFINMKFVTIKM